MTPRKKQKLSKQLKTDLLVATAFVGAISILLLVAGYVIQRLVSEKAHQEKWKDYIDCGI
jgi:hypothetical protein